MRRPTAGLRSARCRESVRNGRGSRGSGPASRRNPRCERPARARSGACATAAYSTDWPKRAFELPIPTAPSKRAVRAVAGARNRAEGRPLCSCTANTLDMRGLPCTGRGRQPSWSRCADGVSPVIDQPHLPINFRSDRLHFTDDVDCVVARSQPSSKVCNGDRRRVSLR